LTLEKLVDVVGSKPTNIDETTTANTSINFITLLHPTGTIKFSSQEIYKQKTTLKSVIDKMVYIDQAQNEGDSHEKTRPSVEYLILVAGNYNNYPDDDDDDKGGLGDTRNFFESFRTYFVKNWVSFLCLAGLGSLISYDIIKCLKEKDSPNRKIQ